MRARHHQAARAQDPADGRSNLHPSPQQPRRHDRELSPADIDRGLNTYFAFEEADQSEIFDNESFGHSKVKVERPCASHLATGYFAGKPASGGGAEPSRTSWRGDTGVAPVSSGSTCEASVTSDLGSTRPAYRAPPIDLLAVRQALHRGARQLKYLIGDYPVLLPVLLRITPEGTRRAIDADTKLVIESFPRSGSTFATFAFRYAQGPGVRVVTHVHHPAQVKLAVRRGLPTLLVIRRPLPCLASYLVAAPHGRPAGVLKEYVRYLGALLPERESVVVGEFERVSTAFSEVINDINERFGTSFAPFDQSDESVDRVWQAVEAYWSQIYRGKKRDRTLPRPSADRTYQKREFVEALRAPELSSLLEEAEEMYRRWVSP
jgi:hypothetical protein